MSKKPKIAVILQLFWIRQWPEMAEYLRNIKYKYDLYVSIPECSHTDAEIKSISHIIKLHKQDSIILTTKNVGMDIGQCFHTMRHILDCGKSYKYYLKLHTKASIDSWRKELITPICGTSENVDNCMNILRQPNVGMVGAKRWLLTLMKGDICTENNYRIISQYAKKLNWQDVSIYGNKFVGGTMFWVNGEIWEQFFKDIDIDETIKNFKPGRSSDAQTGTYEHSLERIFGLMVAKAGKQVVSCEYKVVEGIGQEPESKSENSSLAVFVHYSRDGNPCPNAILYAENLAKKFDKVVISSNINISTNNEKIRCLKFDINAYDFGYFYHALIHENAFEKYKSIGFFNDSNYVIKPLDEVLNWCLTSEYDVCGITDSHECRYEIQEPDQTHIQSHFIVYKNEAVKHLQDYISKINFQQFITESPDMIEIRRRTVIDCEIGLSIALRKLGMKLAAFYPADMIFHKWKPEVSNKCNSHIYLWKELIENGYPLIKKKIYNQSFPAVDLAWINSRNEIAKVSTAREVLEANTDNEYIQTIK